MTACPFCNPGAFADDDLEEFLDRLEHYLTAEDNRRIRQCVHVAAFSLMPVDEIGFAEMRGDSGETIAVLTLSYNAVGVARQMKRAIDEIVRLREISLLNVQAGRMKGKD